MDWENERYVRIYTRDTVNWTLLPWEAKCLLPLIMRKVDRAGVLDIGEHDPSRAVAAVTDVPLDVVGPALAALIAGGMLEVGAGYLVAPNYLPAQEAKQSDKQRQAECRARRRDMARYEARQTDGVSQNVTDATPPSGAGEEQPVDELQRDGPNPAHRGDPTVEVSQNVTDQPESGQDRHTVSHGVTPSLAVPSLASFSLSSSEDSQPAPTSRSDRARAVLEHINACRKVLKPNARGLKPTDANLRQIRQRLKDGESPDDLIAVADHATAEAKSDRTLVRWVNPVTLYRATNWPRNLAKLDDDGAATAPGYKF